MKWSKLTCQAGSTKTTNKQQTNKHKHKFKHKHTSTQAHKHTNTQTHKHTNTQTHKHTNTQTHKHTNQGVFGSFEGAPPVPTAFGGLPAIAFSSQAASDRILRLRIPKRQPQQTVQSKGFSKVACFLGFFLTTSEGVLPTLACLPVQSTAPVKDLHTLRNKPNPEMSKETSTSLQEAQSHSTKPWVCAERVILDKHSLYPLHHCWSAWQSFIVSFLRSSQVRYLCSISSNVAEAR